jgi:hypothetical protein
VPLAAKTDTVLEPARDVPVVAVVQVVVLGGGPAGIAAAVAAARSGARTILLERYGFLGGMGTAAGVTSFCGLYASAEHGSRQVVGGVASEVLDRLRQAKALNTPHMVLGRIPAVAYDNAAYKCVADDLVTGAGVDLWLHTWGARAQVEDGRVTGVYVETKSGRGFVRGDVFIDCSGDGDLAASAGSPHEISDHLAYPTLMFRVHGVDTPRALAEGKPQMRDLMDKAEASGDFVFARKSAYINPQPHAGEWRANVTHLGRDGHALDGSDAADLRWGEVEGRRQVRDFVRFLTARVPGFERAYLLEIAPQLGIRESRRISGKYRLTGADVLAGRQFADSIGLNPWPVELHGEGGVQWKFIEERGFHDIPLRMLEAEGPRNLLVAGRCASATQDAQASLRVSGPCFVMGQAAGTAAALSCSSATTLTDVPHSLLRRTLEEHGAIFA